MRSEEDRRRTRNLRRYIRSLPDLHAEREARGYWRWMQRGTERSECPACPERIREALHEINMTGEDLT